MFDGLLDFALGSKVGETDDSQLDADDDTDEEDDDSTDDCETRDAVDESEKVVATTKGRSKKKVEKDPSKKEKKSLFGRGRFGKKSADGTTTTAAAAAAATNDTDASATKASTAATVEASTESISKDNTVDHLVSSAPTYKSDASNTPSKRSLFRRRNKKASGTTKETPENDENEENDHCENPAIYASMVGAAAAIGIGGTAATATVPDNESNKQNETEDGTTKDGTSSGKKKLSTSFRNKFRKHGKVHGENGGDEEEEEEKTTDSNSPYSFWAPQDETKVEPIEARKQDAEASKLTKKRSGVRYEGKKIKDILGDLKKNEEHKEPVDSDGEETAGRSNKTPSDDEGTGASCMPTRKDYNDAMVKFDTEYLPKMALAMLCLVPAEESVELGYQEGSKRRARRSRSRRARFEEDEQ
mmetsp:Transcript_19232/g.41578  ORF Transcript_19232/g.41578 Transcript_19232/m.41578 type:complete len:415 (-) Transcript_19232:155-1399(-)